LVKTSRRVFVTKTKWMCIMKTPCLPCRISLFFCIDQAYDAIMRRIQAFKYELVPSGGQQRDMGRFAGRAGLWTTRP
jgi:hypothetical protein